MTPFRVLRAGGARAQPDGARQPPALRGAAGRGGGEGDDPDVHRLEKFQCLKKKMQGGPAHRERLGDLHKATARFMSAPANQHKGFLCFRKLTKDAASGKARAVLVATTRNLMKRFASTGPGGTCAADGGFKYSVMGWPLTVHGTINPAGNLAECALILTSDMQGATMLDALVGFRDAARAETGQVITKAFAMSDAAANYREAQKEAYSAQNLMCWYHIVAAVRDWFKKWCRLSQQEADAVWKQVVNPDLACMHEARGELDFRARARAVLERWGENGVAGVTRHIDGAGQVEDMVGYFTKQWLTQAPEWHSGFSQHPLPLPSTNNACESCVGKCRDEAGGVETGAVTLAKFMLTQVEFFSKRKYDPYKTRAVESSVWSKAAAYPAACGKPPRRPFSGCESMPSVGLPSSTSASRNDSQVSP